MSRWWLVVPALVLVACGVDTPAPVRLYLPVAARSAGLKGVGVVVMPGSMPEDVTGIGASWWHNWYLQPHMPVGGFVPTVWGRATVGGTVATASGPLLTFNEPNGPGWEGGSSLSPADAAELWAEVARAYPDHNLVAPTLRTQTHPDYPGWRAWLDEWWARLAPEGRVRVTAMSCNCFADTATCRQLIGAVREWGRAHGVDGPAWLKEFQDPALVPWLEEQGIHYAWFVARVPPEMNGVSVWGRPLFDTGGLTEWGSTYRELP